jgi:hypothetical protein
MEETIVTGEYHTNTKSRARYIIQHTGVSTQGQIYESTYKHHAFTKYRGGYSNARSVEYVDDDNILYDAD